MNVIRLNQINTLLIFTEDIMSNDSRILKKNRLMEKVNIIIKNENIGCIMVITSLNYDRLPYEFRTFMYQLGIQTVYCYRVYIPKK